MGKAYVGIMGTGAWGAVRARPRRAAQGVAALRLDPLDQAVGGPSILAADVPLAVELPPVLPSDTACTACRWWARVCTGPLQATH